MIGIVEPQAETGFSGLTAALRLDLWVLRPYAKQLAAFVAAMLIFGAFTGWGATGLIIAAIYAAPLASYPFAASEKNRLETLYAALPVARRTLILARYLVTTAIWLGLTTAFALVSALDLGRSATSDPQAWAMLLPLAAVMFAVLVGIQLPVMYRFGYTSAKLFGYLPLLLVAAVIGLAGAMAPALLEGFFLGWSALPSWLGWLVAAGLLAASYAVAVRTARLSG
jgi:hypothetical protein